MRIATDLRDALRSLRATPVITAVAVLSLALGIGANTALFSILNGLVLRPLPVHEPERLAILDGNSWTYPIWESLKPHGATLVDGAFVWSPAVFNLAERGTRDPVSAAYASGDLFRVLGVDAELGRTFGPDDDQRTGGRDGAVAVISDGLWKRRFAGSSSVVGQRLLLDQQPFTIVGVLPASFFGMNVGSVADVIVPIATHAIIAGKDHRLDNRSAWWLDMYVRLRPGQTLTQATAALNSVRADVREASIPLNWTGANREGFLKEPWVLAAASTGQSPFRARYAQPLTIVLVVVGMVLLIACANIANLLLARASGRRVEMCLRLALGASRWTIARLLLLESALLGLVGAIAGLLLARLGAGIVVDQLSSSVNRVEISLTPDWRVLAFTASIGMITTLLFGLAPVVGLRRLVPNEVLKEGSRSVAGDRRFGLRNALVIAQVALSLALVVGAGLFVRTFSALTTKPIGFDAERLTVATISLSPGVVDDAARLESAHRFVEAAMSVAGVEKASVSLFAPMSGVSWNDRARVRGGLDVTGRQSETFVNGVGPGFFETFGIPLLAGQGFSRGDTRTSQHVAVVTEAFVKRFVGDVAPPSVIGRTIIVPSFDKRPDDEIQIVGVARDSIYRSVRQGIVPVMYVPFDQIDDSAARVPVTVRLAGSGGAGVERALADAFARVDGSATFSFRSYNDMLRAPLAAERITAILSGFFGTLALLLAGLGLYGVTAYAVNRQRSEIAIRMALGASAGVVVRAVLTRVAVMVTVGVAAGVGLSWWAATYVQTLMFGVPARDVITMVAAAGVLGITGVAAAWLPARRASRLDPAAVLRD